ncbi:hypothetical protein [Paenibacillus beijingensis]|uniref:Uncharacterized protein n=1 Tax=Paenibacillus beijingensis TaxID=1126833 RepID=A0A0D5NMQ2_9BACL|nr:hypothetical protein [Paenibacillus beijingensis]AJY76183.1 hypothetical protein VN24_18470 [Paenibacillus beijingensis]
MTIQNSDLEKQIIEVCKTIVVQLRGNQAGEGNTIINLELIKTLHEILESYKVHIDNEEFVNKNIVGLLFYTCSRFYIQSKYSKNSAELLTNFDKLNFKLIKLYTTNL